MNKILLIITAFSLLNCSKDLPKRISDLENKSIENISNLPLWVLEPSIKDGVAAVGIASPSRGGIKFQIPQAQIDAKANIAAILQSEISRVTKTALRESKLNDVNDVEKFFSEATKDVIKNVKMSGVKRINIYQGNDGTLYVHMALTGDDYSQFLKASQDSYKNALKKSNLGRENINKSEEASKDMFKELEKERKSDKKIKEDPKTKDKKDKKIKEIEKLNEDE